VLPSGFLVFALAGPSCNRTSINLVQFTYKQKHRDQNISVPRGHIHEAHANLLFGPAYGHKVVNMAPGVFSAKVGAFCATSIKKVHWQS
jgi:hypothetical protein